MGIFSNIAVEGACEDILQRVQRIKNDYGTETKISEERYAGALEALEKVQKEVVMIQMSAKSGWY
jgi:hypothetical protein